MRQVAPIAAEQDLAQVYQAVDGFLDEGEGTRGRSLAMFHLAVTVKGINFFDPIDDALLHAL
jgi:hypothetical protein